jgi:hypothetical protein
MNYADTDFSFLEFRLICHQYFLGMGPSHPLTTHTKFEAKTKEIYFMTPQRSFSVAETRVKIEKNKKNKDSRGESESTKNSAVPPGGEGCSSVVAIFPF